MSDPVSDRVVDDEDADYTTDQSDQYFGQMVERVDNHSAFSSSSFGFGTGFSTRETVW